MRALWRCLLGGSAGLLALGCGGGGRLPGQVSVETDRQRYRAGERVLLRIRNPTGAAVLNDLCEGEVEGLHPERGWSGTLGAARACLFDHQSASAVRPIPARGVGADTFDLNACAYAGRWRVTLGLRDSAGRPLPPGQRTSNEFVVESERGPA